MAREVKVNSVARLHEVPWVRDLVGCLSTHKYAAKRSLEGTVIATRTADCIIRALPPQLQNSGKLSQASLRSRTQLHENVSHDRLRICFFEPSLMLLLFVTHSSIVGPPLDDVFFSSGGMSGLSLDVLSIVPDFAISSENTE